MVRGSVHCMLRTRWAGPGKSAITCAQPPLWAPAANRPRHNSFRLGEAAQGGCCTVETELDSIGIDSCHWPRVSSAKRPIKLGANYLVSSEVLEGWNATKRKNNADCCCPSGQRLLVAVVFTRRRWDEILAMKPSRCPRSKLRLNWIQLQLNLFDGQKTDEWAIDTKTCLVLTQCSACMLWRCLLQWWHRQRAWVVDALSLLVKLHGWNNWSCLPHIQ